MQSKDNLLFIRDPGSFMEIVLSENRPKSLAALRGNVIDEALCEIMRFGMFDRPDLIGPIKEFYNGRFLTLEVRERLETYLHIKGLLETTDFLSTRALIPFIMLDPARVIVSSASIDFVSLSDTDPDDPMSRVKELAALIVSKVPLNPGAVFGGLLHLGDDRVSRLLWPLRNALSPDDRWEALSCQTGLLHAAVLSFYLDWMEELQSNQDDSVFGELTAALYNEKRRHNTDWIATGRRPFPVTSVDQKVFMTMMQIVPLSEYISQVAPRLQSISKKETPPKVLPKVMELWGISELD